MKPPYILDFGKCYVDFPPDYPPDAIVEVERKLIDDFGAENLDEINALLWDLERLGIYYVDAKPGNIAL